MCQINTMADSESSDIYVVHANIPTDGGQIETFGATIEKVGEDESEDEDINLDDYIDVSIKCRFCDFVCSSRTAMASHIKGLHLPKKPKPTSAANVGSKFYLCGQCQGVFQTMEACKEHMVMEHQLIRRKGQAVTTDNPNHSKLEPSDQGPALLTNSQVESQVLLGGKRKRTPTFKAGNNAESLISKKTKLAKVRCPERGCQYSFDKEKLDLHLGCHLSTVKDLEVQAIDEKAVFFCPTCSQQFDKWRRCSYHLWNSHNIDVDMIPCPFCDYRTTIPVRLSNHIKIHSDSRNYSCLECGKAYRQLAQLKNHSVTHLDKAKDGVPRWYAKKQCDLCKKFFSDSKSLKKHVQAVHSKLKPYICQVCNHQSARKSMLDLHMRQHTGEKPFKCDMCEYRSGDHNSFRRHRMRHTGEKMYSCSHCKYACIQSSALKKHIASKHPNVEDSGLHSCSRCKFQTVSFENLVDHEKEAHPEVQLLDPSKSEHPNIVDIHLTPDPATSSIITPSSVSQLIHDESSAVSIVMEAPTNTTLAEGETITIEVSGMDPKTNRYLLVSDGGEIHVEEEVTDLGGTTIPADAQN